MYFFFHIYYKYGYYSNIKQAEKKKIYMCVCIYQKKKNCLATRLSKSIKINICSNQCALKLKPLGIKQYLALVYRKNR